MCWWMDCVKESSFEWKCNFSKTFYFVMLCFIYFDFIKFVRIKLKFAKPFTITFTVFQENSTPLSSYNVPLSAVFFLVLENFSDSMSDVKDLYWSNFYLSSYMALQLSCSKTRWYFDLKWWFLYGQRLPILISILIFT